MTGMLRRKDSKSRQPRPLGRSKSTGAIAPKRFYDLHRDPLVAERDAHIAARLSYQRAQGRNGEGMSTLRFSTSSPDPDHGDSGISRRDFAFSDSARDHFVNTREVPGPSRQQSIRYTGKGARSRKTMSSRGSEQRFSNGISDSDTLYSGEASQRARTAMSEGAESSFYSTNPHQTVKVVSEDASFGDNAVLMPSLNPKLRKSRSMFNSSEHTQPMQFPNDSPLREKDNMRASRYASLNKENAPLDHPEPPTLRAPKSMTFLQNRARQTAPLIPSRAERDLAVQLAREKFQEQIQQPRLKSHSSLFFKSKSRRTDSSTGMRKSFRNSSNNSAALSSAFSNDTLSLPKQGSLRKTARKVSRSLKTKLKGFFGRQRSSEVSVQTSDVPAAAQDSDDDAYLRLDPQFEDEGASISRGPSRIASLHAVPSSQQIQSRQGSIDSCEGELVHTPDDKSRVTSWTDSVTNTVVSVPPSGDWERQRLSVIKENGMHVSSAAQAQSNPSSDLAIGKALAVDSQRVYSALMKRASELKKREGEARIQSMEEMRSQGKAPARSSSVDQFASSDWLPQTIRCVQPDDDVFQDSNTDGGTIIAGSSDGHSHTSSRRPAPSASRCGSPNPWVGDHQSKAASPGKMSISSQAPADRGKALIHRSSAFFASPSNHLFRTASPYRRALQENMQTSTAGESTSGTDHWQPEYPSSVSAVSLPKRCPSTGGSAKGTQGLYAESVYSTGDDEEQPDASLVERFPKPPAAHSHGAAIIFPKHTKPNSTYQPTRDVSTASSFEWKTWLSANVAKLEDTEAAQTNHARSDSPGILPPLSHVREKAEIGSSADFEFALKPVRPPLEKKSRDVPIASPSPSEYRGRPQNGNENEHPWGQGASSADEVYPTALKSNLRTYPSLPVLPTAREHSSMKQTVPSLPHTASTNTVSHATPPNQREEIWQRRRARYFDGDAVSSTKSSPGLTAAVQSQFGMVGKSTQSRSAEVPEISEEGHLGSSNASPGDFATAVPAESASDAQAIGSRKMVDMFLNSRRRGTDEVSHGGRSENSPAAFL